MRTVVFAYHDIGLEAVKTLRAMGEEICGIWTHEDDPGENLWFGSVKNLALDMKIPVYTPEDPNSEDWIEKIRSLEPDILFSFYYRKLISEEILRIPPKGALNLHGSLLPKFRGRSPVNWALVKGETETGLTLHEMVKKPDAGDIVAQKKILISHEDTALTLFKKLVPLTEKILRETVPLLAQGKAQRIPQDEGLATTFRGRVPDDGLIDWTRPSEEIYNLVRAVTHPYPGAFTSFGGRKVFIWKAWPVSSRASDQPGRVISLTPLAVACGQGALVLENVQTESKKESSGEAWAKENKMTLDSNLI